MSRFDADSGSGFRGNTADFGSGASGGERGGNGMEQNNTGVESSAIPGHPHSSHGFRRALMKQQRTGSRLKDQLPDGDTFSGKGFKKPSYFAQGGQRHGLHISSGAPHTSGAHMEGSDAGGTD